MLCGAIGVVWPPCPRRPKRELLMPGGMRLRLSERPLLHHVINYDLLTILSRLRMAPGIKVAGRLH